MPEGRSMVDTGQDGSLPWLAPSDGANAPASDVARSEVAPLRPERPLGRQVADADARPQAAASRPDARTAAPSRSAATTVMAPASVSDRDAGSAAARRVAPEEPDANGSITTLQPADEQVAMNRVAEGGRRISIHAKFDTWVEVRRGGGAPVFSKLMKAGETFEVPAQPGYKLSTGNAAGIDLMVDGQRLSPLGKSGAVRKNVALEPEALLRSPGVAP
jgi:cytoskeleton protein RodZ